MIKDQKLTELVEQNKGCAEACNEQDFWKKLSILPRSTIRQGEQWKGHISTINYWGSQAR